MINSFDFFNLSEGTKMSWALAIAFELGAAASLASLIILDRINKTLVWALFITLTIFQVSSNIYHAYSHLQHYNQWIELFGLTEEDPITQKRILSIVSGAFLPLIALGFIKILINYIRPVDKINESIVDQVNSEYGIANILDTPTPDAFIPQPEIEDKKHPWESNEEVKPEPIPDGNAPINEGVNEGVNDGVNDGVDNNVEADNDVVYDDKKKMI